jgi:hypothetical protein
MNIFDRINSAIEDAEGSIITLVTTLIPWLAPALPAYLTYSHLHEIGIPFAVAVAMALCVEGLGLSAVATAFSAMRHNKQHRAEVRRVSLAFPIGAYLFYLIVIITVNVVLSLPLSDQIRQYAQVGAIALLTLISAPAFVIAVARQDQRQVVREWQGQRQERRSIVTVSDKTGKATDNLSVMSVDDIVRQYGISERTAYRWKAKANGNGKNGGDYVSSRK